MTFFHFNKFLWIVLILLLPSTLLMADESSKSMADLALEKVNKRIQNIDTKELKVLFDKEKDLVLIDVRLNAEIDAAGGERK